MSAADDLAGSLVTVNDGRASLGVTALWIRKGYQRAADLSGAAAVDPEGLASGADVTAPVSAQQQAANDLLDQLNTYAQSVYAELDARPGDDTIGDLGRQRTALALRQAEHAFALIDGQAADRYASSLVDDWIAAVKAVIVGIAKGVDYVVKKAAQVAADALSPLQSTLFTIVAIVVAGGALYLLARRAVS